MTCSPPRVPPDHAGHPVCHLLWCPTGEGARANPGSGGAAEAGQREARVGVEGKRDGFCSPLPGPWSRPGQMGPGLRIKDFYTVVQPFPPPSSPGLPAPCPGQMRSWRSREGPQTLSAHRVCRRHTWRAEATDLGSPAAEHKKPQVCKSPGHCCLEHLIPDSAACSEGTLFFLQKETYSGCKVH